MARPVGVDTHLAQRIKLRQIGVFLEIAESGSMAKAAERLRISQPAVSAAISELEAVLRIKLLDRNSRGVELTNFGEALLKGSIAAFEELSQSIQTIQSLSDPDVGHITVGATTPISNTLLAPIVQSFRKRYPGIVVNVKEMISPAFDVTELRKRRLDIAIARSEDTNFDHNGLNLVTLLHDRHIVVASLKSKWAKMSAVEPRQLASAVWVLPPADTLTYARVAQMFRTANLDMPNVGVVTSSVTLRARLCAMGSYVTVIPAAMLQWDPGSYGLKDLGVPLKGPYLPVLLATLKQRTLRPSVHRFIQHARDFTKSTHKAN